MWKVSQLVDMAGDLPPADWTRFATDWAWAQERPESLRQLDRRAFRALSEAICGTPDMSSMVSVSHVCGADVQPEFRWPAARRDAAAAQLQKSAADLRDVRLGDADCDTVCLEVSVDRNTFPSSFLLCPRAGSRDGRVQLVLCVYETA